MVHQELSPEARKALVQCYRLLYRWGREAMAAEAKAQAEQSADEARPALQKQSPPETNGAPDEIAA